MRGHEFAPSLWGGPGFVDEHEPVWVEINLGVEPFMAPAQNVGTVLLRDVACFFRVMRWRWKNRRQVP